MTDGEEFQELAAELIEEYGETCSLFIPTSGDMNARGDRINSTAEQTVRVYFFGREEEAEKASTSKAYAPGPSPLPRESSHLRSLPASPWAGLWQIKTVKPVYVQGVLTHSELELEL